MSPDIEKYRERLAKDPQSLVFAQLADAFRKAGKFEEAIQTCLDGLKGHPHYVSAHMVLGRTHLERGALGEAAAAFRTAIKLDPDNVLAHRFLGQIAVHEKRWGDAAAAYEAVLAISPFDRETREAMDYIRPYLASSWPAAQPKPTVVAPESVAPTQPPTLEPQTPTEESFATETLADMYASQGFHDRAAEIYEELLRAHPQRTDLAQKLHVIRRAMESSAPVGSPTGTPVQQDSNTAALITALETWRHAVRQSKISRRRG